MTSFRLGFGVSSIEVLCIMFIAETSTLQTYLFWEFLHYWLIDWCLVIRYCAISKINKRRIIIWSTIFGFLKSCHPHTHFPSCRFAKRSVYQYTFHPQVYRPSWDMSYLTTLLRHTSRISVFESQSKPRRLRCSLLAYVDIYCKCHDLLHHREPIVPSYVTVFHCHLLCSLFITIVFHLDSNWS